MVPDYGTSLIGYAFVMKSDIQILLSTNNLDIYKHCQAKRVGYYYSRDLDQS